MHQRRKGRVLSYLKEENKIEIAQWLTRNPDTGEVTIDENCPWVYKNPTKPNAKPQIRCWSLNPAKKTDSANGNIHSLQMFAWVVLGKNPYPGKKQFDILKGGKLNMNPEHLRLKVTKPRSKPKAKVIEVAFSNHADEKQLVSKWLEEYIDEEYGGTPEQNADLLGYFKWLESQPELLSMKRQIKAALNKSNIQNHVNPALKFARMFFSDIVEGHPEAWDKAQENMAILKAIRDVQTDQMIGRLRKERLEKYETEGKILSNGVTQEERFSLRQMLKNKGINVKSKSKPDNLLN